MVVVYAYLKSTTPNIVLGWGTAEMIVESGNTVLIDLAREVPARELSHTGEWHPANQPNPAPRRARRTKRARWFPT